jgi:hypothetical protein
MVTAGCHVRYCHGTQANDRRHTCERLYRRTKWHTRMQGLHHHTSKHAGMDAPWKNIGLPHHLTGTGAITSRRQAAGTESHALARPSE